MKINDFIISLNLNSNIKDSIYRIRSYINIKQERFVIITDLGIGISVKSVTNFIEDIRKELIELGFIDLNTIVIEHYDYDNNFDIVFFEPDTSWKNIKVINLVEKLNTTHEDLKISTFDIERLNKNIEKCRFLNNPFFNSNDFVDWELLKRRENILSNKIDLLNLESLINSRAKETEIQKLISQDLSIFADLYANPKEEYICFKEFPLNNGFVDFVLFTGRSRMEVILIEIKGANYDFLTSNSYKNFSAKTNEAIQQIRSRIGFLIREYEKFRKYVHKIREEVYSDTCEIKSLIGPIKKLEVDPNKDIIVKCIVIGGIGKNDYLESKLRHEFESQQSIPTKLESWNSLLRKLK